jgi:hypothetical protein
MWAMLLPILSQLGGKIGDYFNQLNEIKKQELETQRQIEVAKQQMASDIAKAQLDLNKTIVNATGSYFKYFTFFMWFGPFMIGTVWPSKAHDIFTNLSGMPQWYVQSCMLIMFTVWGISVSAPVVSNIFTGLGQFMADRREYKLEKARINRETFFKSLRNDIFKKGMTQSQVDAIDKALDEGEK